MEISFVAPAIDNPPSIAPFGVSPAASARICYLLSDEPAGSYFRISVLGGGCSGFQYHFDLDASALSEEDRRIDTNVVIDDVSLDLLKGSIIDYVELLGSAGFEIRNPNATAKCGCGNSFAM